MEKNDHILAKILILVGFAALLLISAVLEGYTNYLHGYIIVFFAALLAACIMIACVKTDSLLRFEP